MVVCHPSQSLQLILQNHDLFSLDHSDESIPQTIETDIGLNLIVVDNQAILRVTTN